MNLGFTAWGCGGWRANGLRASSINGVDFRRHGRLSRSLLNAKLTPSFGCELQYFIYPVVVPSHVAIGEEPDSGSSDEIDNDPDPRIWNSVRIRCLQDAD